MTQVIHLPIHLFRSKGGQMVEAGNGAIIDLVQNPDFSTIVLIKSTPNNEIIISTEVREVLNVQFISAEFKVLFDLQFKQKTYNFYLVFNSLRDMQTFIYEYVRCCFESQNKKGATVKDKDDLDRFVSYLSLDKPDETYPDEISFVPNDYVLHGDTDSGRNALLRPFNNSRNAYVMRKYQNNSMLGLFTIDQDCHLDKSLQNIVDDKNRVILADDMLNSNSDRSLLILDETRPQEIYNMDLSRGLVVSHFDSVDNYGVGNTVKKLMPTTPMNTDPTFLAITDRNTLLFDPRASNSIVDKSSYKTANHFTCGNTTRNGYVALGSSDGIVRLYNGPCKSRATVNFLMNVGGEPVTSIDVSSDEQWVLATCPYYLCVFNVLAPSTGKLGFCNAMGKDKPALTRLALESKDQQILINEFNGVLPQFSPAKFQEKNGRIDSIVAGIGSCLVSWDFRKIENGALPKYSIKFFGTEEIVDNDPLDATYSVMFMTNNSLSVIQRERSKRKK